QGHLSDVPGDVTGALRCARGHSFDVARQGYVNLLVGPAPAGAETADMLTARAELLGAGHFAPVAAALAETAAALAPGWSDPPGPVVDAGAGTGYYLSAVLD